jgi:hypothetical protein
MQYSFLRLLWWSELREERPPRRSLGSSLCSSPLQFFRICAASVQSQSVRVTLRLATNPLRLTTSKFILQLNICCYTLCVTYSLMRGCVCRPRQRSHSQVRVPRDSWPYFPVSYLRLLQPGGPRPRIYIPQEQGDPVIPPSPWFTFLRLLRLAGLRWRYSTPPPQGNPAASV